MVRKARAAVALTVLVAVAAAGVAGCGDDDNDSGAAPATTEAPATTAAPAATATAPAETAPAKATVRVDADPSGQLAFVQKSLTAPAGADTFILTNDSTVPHNLEIEGTGVEAGPSATVSGGQTADLKVTLKPGTYEFYCAVPGHKEAGMEGTLTVQ